VKLLYHEGLVLEETRSQVDRLCQRIDRTAEHLLRLIENDGLPFDILLFLKELGKDAKNLASLYKSHNDEWHELESVNDFRSRKGITAVCKADTWANRNNRKDISDLAEHVNNDLCSIFKNVD
jgi:hypothetical protein